MSYRTITIPKEKIDSIMAGSKIKLGYLEPGETIETWHIDDQGNHVLKVKESEDIDGDVWP